VTLGSPLLGPLRYTHPLLHLGIELTTSLGDRGVPQLFTHKCADDWVLDSETDLNPISRALVKRARRRLAEGDSCCAPFWRDVRAPFPSEVQFASFYSRTDGIVHWRGCLDPGARHVEVHATHSGMGFSKRVYAALARELWQLAAAGEMVTGEALAA
jgi:hypothetical protein